MLVAGCRSSLHSFHAVKEKRPLGTWAASRTWGVAARAAWCGADDRQHEALPPVVSVLRTGSPTCDAGALCRARPWHLCAVARARHSPRCPRPIFRARIVYIVRNILAALALSLVVLTTSASAQGAPLAPGKQADARAGLRPTRIAVFDSRIVLDSMPERSRAESELALAQAQARVKLEAAKDSLRAAVDELAKFEQTMSMREREAVTLNLRARELLVEETVARLDQDVQRAYVTLRQPMVERLRAAVRAVREKEGYDLLLDLASEGLMLEASPSINLTSLVLRELRKPVADARNR